MVNEHHQAAFPTAGKNQNQRPSISPGERHLWQRLHGMTGGDTDEWVDIVWEGRQQTNLPHGRLLDLVDTWESRGLVKKRSGKRLVRLTATGAASDLPVTE